MVHGAYKRNYKNENVNELRDKLFKEFMFNLKDSNEVEVCLYILNEEFEDDQGATKYNKHELNSSFFLDCSFSIKEIDGVECLFTKARVSNKAKKRLLSGRYMLDIHTLVWPKVDVVGDNEKSTSKELYTKLVEISEVHSIIAMFVKYVRGDDMPIDLKKITPALRDVKRKQINF